MFTLDCVPFEDCALYSGPDSRARSLVFDFGFLHLAESLESLHARPVGTRHAQQGTIWLLPDSEQALDRLGRKYRIGFACGDVSEAIPLGTSMPIEGEDWLLAEAHVHDYRLARGTHPREWRYLLAAVCTLPPQ